MSAVNLAKARILVTNDDGIHAPGLQALIEIAEQLSSDVWVVAPEVNQSGAGHSLSLSRPIRSRASSRAAPRARVCTARRARFRICTRADLAR